MSDGDQSVVSRKPSAARLTMTTIDQPTMEMPRLVARSPPSSQERLPQEHRASQRHDASDDPAGDRELGADALGAHHPLVAGHKHHQREGNGRAQPTGNRAGEEQLDRMDAE